MNDINFMDYIETALDEFVNILENGDKTSQNIDDFINSIEFEQKYHEIFKEIVLNIYGNIRENINNIDDNLRQVKKDYRNSIEKLWGNLLKYLRLYPLMCHDICNGYKEYVNGKNMQADNLFKSVAINAINARALTVYEEVVCLLENGFPEGALAHWRTLFELWMVAEFINDSSDEVAAAYIGSIKEKSSDEQSKYRWARLSGRFEENQNIGINAVISESYKILQQKAKNIASKRKFLSLYNMSNIVLHPSAQGVFSRMSPEEKWFKFSTGPSKYGLDTAAVNAVTVLFNINKLHLELFGNEVSYIGLELLQCIIDNEIFPKAKQIGVEFAKN